MVYGLKIRSLPKSEIPQRVKKAADILALAGSGEDERNLSIKLVEHLGSDTLVHGHFGEDQTDMTIRLAGIQHFKVGEVLPMHIKPGKIHLFDPKTEKRLGD